MKRYPYLLAAAAVLAGGVWYALSPRDVAGPVPAAVAPSAEPPVIAVQADRAGALGITVVPAAPAVLVPLAELPATLAPPPNARVAVPATLPGVVLRTYVVEGDRVARGQPLALVASRDVLTLGADLSRASARLGVAQSGASRLSQLSREGIIAGARADEARALAAEAHADVAEKSRILRMVGGHAASGNYTISSPIAGRVTRAEILAGSPVDGASAPFVIDSDGPTEVTAQVPERLLGTIRPGMTVRIGDAEGTITSVGIALDPMTRSALLKAQLPPGPGMVAGRAATVAVLGPAPAGAVTVPTGAVARVGGEDVVFVALPGGYVVRKVRLAAGSGGPVVILSGLAAGERVVAAGTSALKAMALAK